MRFKAGFIGCGNMGGALARAAARAVGGKNIAVYDRDDKKTESISSECGAVCVNAEALIADSEFVFLGLKPQYIKGVVSPLTDIINESNCIVVSMAAGIPIDFFVSELKLQRPMIRIMPNTPCVTGYGMILYSVKNSVSEQTLSDFEALMAKAGMLDRISEPMIDAGCAVSGCGPAFAFIFAEALADAGVECGLPRDKAGLYAAQMLRGSAELLLNNGSPGALKDSVCSPGGSTIAGVHALETSAFRAAVMNAVLASYKKTLGLNNKGNT